MTAAATAIDESDPGWVLEHGALLELHIDKSATYGTAADRLHNFTAVGKATGQPPERYAIERVMEKCTRALNMIDAGQADDVREYRDIASIGLIAAALQRRRVT